MESSSKTPRGQASQSSDAGQDEGVSSGSRVLKRRRTDSLESITHYPVNSKVKVEELDDAMDTDALSIRGKVKTKPLRQVRATFKRNHVSVTGSFIPPRKRHSVVESTANIVYKPESAIKEGTNMLRSMQDVINLVAFQNTLRQTSLKNEVEMLVELLTTSTDTPKTTIAICGATGVGKSSLLNALLENKIVPSSGTGACTSVVTEITYHDDDTIDADISFDTREEWVKEVSLIREDIASGNDDADAIYEECAAKPPDSQSPAGIAWQKVHAVYPNLKLKDLAEMTTEEVIAMDPDLAAMLGTTKRISCFDSESFQDEIMPYIGSRNQNHRANSEGSDLRSEMWPLITKVVIYCDAEVLSTGASFVDLPGVADSNSARDNIAKEYMQNASHFWIIAPINRAISDKTARDLLGDRFKMQLRNGNLRDHAITFIATKCDQLSCAEIIKEFNLRKDPEFQELEARIKANGPEALKPTLEDLKTRRDDCRAHINALRRDKPYVSKYDRKRKRTEAGSSKLGGSSSRTEFGVPSEPQARDGDIEDPPTLEGLEKKLRGFKKGIEQTTDRMIQYNPAMFEKERKAFCALRRSEYTRKILKSDFRAGIAELDGEDCTSEDYANINLPVFACSSTDYLRLKGRSKDDGTSECFSKVEQTGIPNLQKWVHEITLSARHKGAIEFLSQLSTFTQSVAASTQATEGISDVNKRALRSQWETKEGRETGVSHRLKGGFSAAVKTFVDCIKQRFRDGLEGKCKAGAAQAERSAVISLDQFANSLYWSTYRAALRRHGRFRYYDLNQTLSQPMTSAISHTWPTLFESVTFNKLEEALMSCIDQFLDDFKDSAPAGLEDRTMSNGELCREMVKTILPQIFSNAREVLVRKQKKLSRSLGDHVAEQLHDAYIHAAAQVGGGSVRRQKNIMRDYLEKNRASIFTSGSDTILDGTDSAIGSVGETLEKALGELARKVEMDLSVLWEVAKKDAPQVRARQHLSTLAKEIQGQIQLWQKAAQSKEKFQRRVMDNY